MRKIFICIFLLASIAGVAQFKRDKSISLQRKANKTWELGEIAEAEKMYFEAFSLYPSIVYPLYELAGHKYKIGDYREANKLMDKVIKEHHLSESYSELTYQFYKNFKIVENFKSGDVTLALAESIDFIESFDNKVKGPNKGYYKYIYSIGTEVALALEDEKSLEKYYQMAKTMQKDEYGELVSYVRLCIMRKNYETAILEVNKVIEHGGFLDSRLVAKYLLAEIYTYMGDYENALKYIEEAKSWLISENYFSYLLGINSYNKKEYNDAIVRFTIAIKGWKPVAVRNSLSHLIKPAGIFRIYTKRAETHLALGDLLNAKKDFESALVYNNNYVPAINGIKEVEIQIATERLKDKKPPIISIIEPVSSRGSIVVTTNIEVMIKGIAMDKSGIKDISINGQKVYSKMSGDFWGNVKVKEGLNKVIIIATDMSGNSTEFSLQIEKNGSSISNTTHAKEGKNFALLIASQNYTDVSIQSLEKPISDAVKLKLILKKIYNFNDEDIITLFNPVKSELNQKFIELEERLKPEDNIVIFYAGHGIWLENEKKGYWLLTDAQRNNESTWLSNREMLNMIAELPSRNTLLIADACFSGSVFKTRNISTFDHQNIKDLNNKISRVAITSGNDTEVPDESVFMKYLIKALESNKEKYMTSQKLFVNNILEAVMNESLTEPRYGTLELAGHVGGDYIFSKK